MPGVPDVPLLLLPLIFKVFPQPLNVLTFLTIPQFTSMFFELTKEILPVTDKFPITKSPVVPVIISLLFVAFVKNVNAFILFLYPNHAKELVVDSQYLNSIPLSNKSLDTSG